MAKTMKIQSGKRNLLLGVAGVNLVVRVAEIFVNWELIIQGDWWDTNGDFLWLLLNLRDILGFVAPLGLVALIFGLLKERIAPIITGLVINAAWVLSHYIFSNLYQLNFVNEYDLEPDLGFFAIPILDLFESVGGETPYFMYQLALNTTFMAVIAYLAVLLPEFSATKAPLAVSPDPKLPVSPTTNEGGDMSPTSYCHQCGNPIAENTKFCSSCGTPVGSAAPNTANFQNSAPSMMIPKTNTLAIVSLVISFFIPIVGMILAYSARREIDASQGTQTGRGLTTGAIVLNWIWILSIVLIVFSTGLLLTL